MEEMKSNGGWCAPSEIMYEIEREVAENMGLEIPEVQVTRGGPVYGDPNITPRQRPVAPERDPRGYWQYGVDVADYDNGDTEPDIVYSEYGERFESAQEAYDYGGGKVYKRWVPAPGAWDEVL